MSTAPTPTHPRPEPRRVTPEPLNVAPSLVGLPLGTPMRRALAMGVDLLVVALLSGASGLWLAGGLVLVALQLRHEQAAVASPLRRWAGWALVLLFVGLAAREAWQGWHRAPQPPAHEEAVAEALAEVLDEAGVASAPARAASATAEARAVAQAASAAASVAAGLQRAGVPDGLASTVQGAVQGAMQSAARQAAAKAARAASAADSARAASATASARTAAPASAASGASPEARIAALEAELAQARREARQRKPLTLGEELERLLDAAGASFGWGVVYFSLLPAFWNGQTLGKRLFRLQVVELTGQPMTVMRCLRRYGGYAAGMATGGLGFAQLLWDVNRQGIQDRTAHTVVIDARGRVPLLRPDPATPAAPAA